MNCNNVASVLWKACLHLYPFLVVLAIGIGAVSLLLSLGRILCATNILSGKVFAEDREIKWRAEMIIGMIAATILIFLFAGKMPEVNVPIHPSMIVLGGIVTGFGASLGFNRTFGHELCGL